MCCSGDVTPPTGDLNMSKETQPKTVQLHKEVYDCLTKAKKSESESFNDTVKRLLRMNEEEEYPQREPDEYHAGVNICGDWEERVFFTEDEVYAQEVDGDPMYGGNCFKKEIKNGNEIISFDITPEKIFKIRLVAKTKPELMEKIKAVKKWYIEAYNKYEEERVRDLRESFPDDHFADPELIDEFPKEFKICRRWVLYSGTVSVGGSNPAEDPALSMVKETEVTAE
jgi:hypothetical protein